MMYKAILRENASGEIRSYYDETNYKGTEEELERLTDFMWTEGNYSCDCNRLLFFVRSGGEPEPTREVIVCGEGAFTLLGLARTGSKGQERSSHEVSST